MKTCQMMMVDSLYLDKPRIYNIGVSWHLGVYLDILLFRIVYKLMTLTMKVSHFTKR